MASRQRSLALPFVAVAPLLGGVIAGCGGREQAPAPMPVEIADFEVPKPAASATVAHAPDDDGVVTAELDTDEDGIADAEDKCPLEPETINGRLDEDGCPDDIVVRITSNPPPVVHIHFRGASAVPVREADAILDEVAKVMQESPHLLLVQIEGHADPHTSTVHAVKISQARADAVRDALVQRGVAPGTLRAVGLGGHCPLDASPHPEARKRNRRVEFKIVTTQSGPTGVELGCEPARRAGLVP